jgi:hypothetical protein
LDTPASSTDRLIARLVAEATPVRRLVDPKQRAALWTALALVCVGIGVSYFGIRGDLPAALTHLPFLVRVGLLGATMWLAVVCAFRLSVPGADQRAWSRWWPLVGLGALIAITAAELVIVGVVGEVGSPLRSWTCVRKLAFVGAVPAVVSIILIQRAAALEPRWAAMLGVLAAGAAGALTSELACPIRLPMHVMLWHVLPVAAYAIVGALAALIAAKLFKG